MTISPIANVEEYWREEDDCLSPAHSIRIKTGLSNGRIKCIRRHLATGVVGVGAKTFDSFRPIQTFFDDRVADCFCPGQRGSFCADHLSSCGRARIVFRAVGARNHHHATSGSRS
jgi:hypothetical protein